MAKQILTKKKIDRQLASQSNLTQLMKVTDVYNNTRAVTFNMQDRLGDKIDKHTSMMSKLLGQGNKPDKHFKPKIYQGKEKIHKA